MEPYFHYPDNSPALRKGVQANTDFYGYLATAILCVFFAAITLQNYLISRGYTPFASVGILRKFNCVLDRAIIKDNFGSLHSRPRRVASSCVQLIKHTLFVLAWSANTITQITGWSLLLGVLLICDSHHGNLVLIAKRMGKVAVVFLPGVFLLTLRPLPLPHTLYLLLLQTHKWLSRVVIIQSSVHVILYLGLFQYRNTWVKAYKTANIYGWIALVVMLWLMITLLLRLRQINYKLFYTSHYLGSWILVIALQLHARPTKITGYTLFNYAVLIGQVLYRFYLTRRSNSSATLRVHQVSPNLLIVDFPNSLIVHKAHFPGAHIRLAKHHDGWVLRLWNQILVPNYHPYTLVSLPQDRFQRLVVRKSTFEIKNSSAYNICGAYEPYLNFIVPRRDRLAPGQNQFSLSRLHVLAQRLLIVVGGLAISFALPLMRTLSYHGIPAKVVWVIKDYRDVAVLKHFSGFVHGDDFEIFVTGVPDDLQNTDSVTRSHDYGSTTNDGLCSQRDSNLAEALFPNEFAIDEQDFGVEEPRDFNSWSLASDLEVGLEQECDSKRNINTNDSDHDRSDTFADAKLEQMNHRDSLNRENEIENVEVSVDGCACAQDDADYCTTHSRRTFGFEHVPEPESDATHTSETSSLFGQPLSPTLSQRTASSTNKQYEPPLAASHYQYTALFYDTVRLLHLEHKVYAGRPCLNYRYYDWCINEGFTQCSGPGQNENNDLVCCRDLIKNRTVSRNVPLENIWVVAAGPKGLVQNVKLWTTEYGMKFHEEAFFV